MALLRSCLEICSVLPHVHGKQNNLDTNMLSGLLETWVCTKQCLKHGFARTGFASDKPDKLGKALQ